MRTIAIALLATTVIGAPASAAANNQQPQTKQMQPQNNAQNQGQSQTQPQATAPQNAQNQQKNQQQAQNQPISPNSLPRDQVRQVQEALNKDGFNAGRQDGRWGPATANAVKQFLQSKQIQPKGQLDQQTLADLGLDASRFQGTQK